MPGQFPRVCLGLILASQPLVCEALDSARARVSFGHLEVTSRDVSRATKIGVSVQRTARDVLGMTDVKFLIIDAGLTNLKWGDTTPSGLPVYPWSFAHGRVDLSVQPPDHILSHEIGHDLFRRYLVPSTRSQQYGTDAPDWLDESVAVAFEASEQKEERRCHALEHLRSGTLIPIQRYLTMSHPDSNATPGVSNSDQAQGFVLAPSFSPETPVFYAMSLAFHEYLVDRLGSTSVLGDIARASLGGEPTDQWILERLRGARGIGETGQLDHDFALWLTSQERYRCTPPT